MGCFIEGIPEDEHLRIMQREKEKLLKELESLRNSQLESQREDFKKEIERILQIERAKIKAEFEEQLSNEALNAAEKKINAYKEYKEIIEKKVSERVEKAIDNFGKIGINVRPLLFVEPAKN